ncbi:MAG: hypothetical protein QOH84_4408 [Kribbellaceae bacterium]|nr:hypothetical protein [Kribbellaceae bacterium]
MRELNVAHGHRGMVQRLKSKHHLPRPDINSKMLIAVVATRLHCARRDLGSLGE